MNSASVVSQQCAHREQHLCFFVSNRSLIIIIVTDIDQEQAGQFWSKIQGLQLLPMI